MDLDPFRFISMIYKSHISPFPAILALRDAWIYICFSNSHNVTSDIKASVNKVFCFGTTLEVPNINPNHSQNRFGRSFDDLVTWYKNGVFKYVSTFNHCFYNVYSNRKISIFNEVRYGLDWRSLGLVASFESTSFKFFIYFSIVFMFEADITLFVVMIISLLLEQIKLAQISDLIPFSEQLIFDMYTLDYSMTLCTLFKLIRIIICSLDSLLIVMFTLGLLL